MKTNLGFCIVLFVALMATSVQAQSSYYLYDDFNSKTIDPDKWIGTYVSTGDTGYLDFVCHIQSGTLHMLNYFYGNTSSDQGSFRGTNRLLLPSDTPGIIGTIQVKAYELTDCFSNSSETQVRARIGGGYFKTGTGTLAIGTVGANIFVRRLSGSTDKANVFEVVGNVYRCNDSYCGISTLLGSLEADVLGTLNKGEKVTLQLEWDQANHRFIFKRDNQPEVYINYKESDNWNPSWDDVLPPHDSRKRLDVLGDVPGCTSEPRPMAFIEVKFDDIYIK